MGFNLSEWALRNRQIVLFLMLLLAIVGALSYTKLGQSEDPPFTFKAMVIRTNWPGATAEEVSRQVTERIEKEADGNRRLRTDRLVLPSGRVPGDLRGPRLPAFGADSRAVVPDTQEDQ
nr:hypothetical protein GCM10020185_17050 [Pseudomonas brassicacearum subsp. brassicacearum]